MRSQTHVVHYVKRPGYGRRSFSIMRRTRSPSGEITTQTLTHERLAAINDQLVAGVLSRASADLAVVQICDELNAEAKKRERGVWVASEDNLNLLNAYFEKEYARRRSDKAAAYARLRRAIDQLGPHSLLGDANTLQRVVDERFGYSSTVQRKYVAAINQMRKWFGVRERLALDREVPPEFRYLSEREFDRRPIARVHRRVAGQRVVRRIAGQVQKARTRPACVQVLKVRPHGQRHRRRWPHRNTV